MGAVAPTHIRLKSCEELLTGNEITPALLNEAAALATEEVRPIDDVRSTAEYRRRVAGTLVKEVLTLALESS